MLKTDSITLGVCYYPEHWDRSLWRDDLKRMKELGLEVIRIAEFSWTIMEPEEGKYDFGFWDDFLDIAQQENMKVIFCTPTATPPAWLTEKYPEVLNADSDGHVFSHGMRRHYTISSEKYIELCSRLVERMAEHFDKKDCIIGWQIDNEINCEVNEYYAECDHEAFRRYLERKYKTLSALNKAMGTVFWNQTYTDWKQIHLAGRTPQGTGVTNPHMQLEQVRFISEAAVRFMAVQAEILRKTAGSRFITTNGIFGHLDYKRLLEAGIDFVMYDNYPNFSYEVSRSYPADDLRDRNASYKLSMVRSINPVFGIMEQQSGPGGWNFRMNQQSPKPGQMRLWTFQSIAHGADYVGYFRWRTAAFGTEIYWHGLNDYSNVPNRRIKELAQIRDDVLKIRDAAGKRYEAEAAILKDYDNEWDAEKDNWYGPLVNLSCDGWFRAFQKNHVPFDFVDFRDEASVEELLKYKYIIYPHPAIMTEKRAAVLEEYAARGGILICGCRTGYKDIHGACPMQPMPGLLRRLLGITVTDFTFTDPQGDTEHIRWGEELLEAPVFNDVIKCEEARAEGYFCESYYAGEAGLTVNDFGKGRAYYYGGAFSEQTADTFIRRLGMKALCSDILELSENIEAAKRGEYLFLLNYQPHPEKLDAKKELKDVISQTTISGDTEISAYGVMVFRINDKGELVK